MTDIATPSVDWLAIAPVLALVGAALLIVLVRALLRQHQELGAVSRFTALAGIVVAALFVRENWREVEVDGPITTISGMVRVDGLAVFLSGIIVLATLLAVLLAADYLEREGFAVPEYLALMLLSASGMLIMASANDLIVVFLALEILSIPLYVLAAFDRRRLRSQEAGIKYFVLGAFSSAIFLYGVALTYGATGTTSLAGVGQFLAENIVTDRGILLVGIVLILVGIAFKIAAVPFHMWAPDVYEGAPTPVTAFMASATKVAGFAALLRVFLFAFPLESADWRPLVIALAIATLAVGSLGAIVQSDVKRMLAYLSIANAGYVLVGFVAAASGAVEAGVSAALIYLLMYSLMVIGAFGVVGAISAAGDRDHALASYRGIGRERPLLAALLVFFLLAQAGVPLTGGFIIKLQVFAAAADAQQYPLLIVAVVVAVVAAFAYLRVVVTVLAREDERDADDTDEDVPAPIDITTVRVRRPQVGFATGLVLAIAVGVTLWLGTLPGTLLDLARDAASRL